ncbi:MAG: hypothetical protein K6F01_06690 [Selenomonas sp.]|uniref:hypothetical protein n=1 Tax=Selenomonas sp. TaxID=2053611 RepID=UPI0025DFADA1|nr:hypothetical protein [Selenomonas sp.]MCR5439106.1 hypothetical protein [Selenomonas sp.]
MCDHDKLERMLNEFFSERHFEEWIPEPRIESLETGLRNFAHELALALDGTEAAEHPLEKAAIAADAVDEIISGHLRGRTPLAFATLADETKALLWAEISLLDELMPRSHQISPNWLEKNLYPECRRQAAF